MLLKAKLRKVLLSGLVLAVVCLVLILIVVPSPDLSVESELLRRIADLEQKIQSAHQTNLARNHDLSRIWKQFAVVTNRLLKSTTNHTTTAEKVAKDLNLSREGKALLTGANWTNDLSMPSIVDSLPHLGK